MQDERRQFRRFDIPLDVKFAWNDSPAFSEGMMLNFSRNGLCFVSSEQSLNVRDVFDLTVKLPNNNSFAHAVGDIVWKKQSGNECFYGVRLMTMTKEDKSSILDKAYDLWLEKMRSENVSDRADG
ncbi:MAG: PilZ domain-containing protein [Nitrospirales bacterium]|nr:PilZ domain-containing protein [Nitrospirales bacterium]